MRCLVILLLLLGSVGLHAGRSIAPAKYRIGLQLYSVRDDCAKDFPGVLKKVAAMGYSGVEFAGYYGFSAIDLRKMLAEDHLECYGSHIQLNDLLGDNFDKTVAFNKALGNKLLVIPWIPEERRNTKAAVTETAKLFGDLAKRLGRQGLMLAYHNHTDEFKTVDGERFWDTFFDNADRQLRIQLDIGHTMHAGFQPAPFLTKYPGRVISVHVKDWSNTNPNALLGEGEVNWKEVVPLLKARNGPRYLVIEQETYPVPPMESVEKCLRTFEAMLAESK